MKNHTEKFFENANLISNLIDVKIIESVVNELALLRRSNGRLFFVGVGGSASNCSHAVNDFRKLCNIESYAVTDNISELTARINDEGWDSSFVEWLKVSKFNQNGGINLHKYDKHNKHNAHDTQINYNIFKNLLTYYKTIHGGDAININLGNLKKNKKVRTVKQISIPDKLISNLQQSIKKLNDRKKSNIIDTIDDIKPLIRKYDEDKEQYITIFNKRKQMIKQVREMNTFIRQFDYILSKN